MASIDKDDESSLKIKKEDSLRAFLSEKPRNAKAMSQLSSALVDRSKRMHPSKGDDSSVDDDAVRLRDEAIVLAKRAIQGAPQRPYGYAALSIAARDWSERRQALMQAIALSSASAEHDHFRLARIGLLVRLLVEEREEESRRVKGKIGGGSKTHPHRRDLVVAETKLYQRIVDDLGVVWKRNDNRDTQESLSSYSHAEKEFVSQQEFRLGQFFRKKIPTETHQPRARHHFQQSRRRLHDDDSYSMSSSRHRQNEMAAFWLATLLPTSAAANDNDNGTTSTSTTAQPDDTKAIDKCPADYVVGLYSTFAARFDKLLVEQLQYQTPTKLRQLLDSVLLVAAQNDDDATTSSPSNNKATQEQRRRGSSSPSSYCFKKICDLGCGTGLSGLAFQELIPVKEQGGGGGGGEMIGVDLSPEMLEQARTRGCYSELHVGDVETTLNQMLLVGAGAENEENDNDNDDMIGGSTSFDLMLACDVFCYIGDLSGIFQAVARSLCRKGFFCFSTELWLEEEEEETGATSDSLQFRLQSCARFSHRQRYVEDLAKSNGFRCLKLQTASIRKNQGSDVKGLLVVLQKI